MHKYTIGQTVRIGPFRVKIVELTTYRSEALKRDLPMYKVQTWLGSSNILDSTVWEAHQHEITV